MASQADLRHLKLRKRKLSSMLISVSSPFPVFLFTLELTSGHNVGTTNSLFDPSTKRVTALLDYDFAYILCPSYEFFRSLGSAGVQFCGRRAMRRARDSC
ncbi:hypothetical protein F5Y12DRAFT_214397 [Xylaria sp. FL1777]|nr:hypothetical protein F5Y12DRAFT_214397 [Xylaria sp. FL1777]